MSRFHAPQYDDQAEINLSPMLDVVFIMLIFFIVVASFVREDGLPVALPDGRGHTPPDFDSIQVRVEAGSTFEVNGRAMAGSNVRDYVRALHGENPEADFIVIFGEGSRVKDAALAIESGRSIGVEVVTVTDKAP